jgi:hypothetical protein
MSVTKKSIHNVLRALYAADPVIEKGKEDAPASETPEKKDIPPKEADTLKIVNRIYLYDIDPNKKISFSNMTTILSGTDEKGKSELIDNLKGGNTADFNADYFKWKTLYVKAVSQQDETKVVVYEYDLNPWGTKSSEGKMVKSNTAGFNPPPPGDVSSDPNYKLFATINQIPDMISLSQGPESFYSTDNVSDQFANKLLISRAESTLSNKMSYDNFKTNIFSYYRIWVPITANELRNVDGSKPTSDQLPLMLQKVSPGHYKGGGTFFKKFMDEGKFKTEEKEEAPAPIAKAPVKPKTPEFTPATNEPKESVPVEKDANIKEINKDDPNVNQYTGDNSVMQDLVRAQHKKMKIRRTAYMSGTAPKKPGMLNVQVPEDNSMAAKKVTDTALKTVQQIEKLKKGLPTMPGTQTTQTTQSAYTSTGMGKLSTSMVEGVVNKYFSS